MKRGEGSTYGNKSRQVSLESKELVEKKRTSKESYVVVIITV
jgi:hypothetical protein